MGLIRFARRIWRHPSNRGRRLRALAAASWWELRGRPTVDVAVMGGPLVRCHADSGVAKGLVHFSGRPEYHEMGFVAHFLRPGDRFADVGANAGYYTVLAATLVGPSGSVEAIEPGIPALKRLRENIALNGLQNVHVHAVAAAGMPGTAAFSEGRDTEDRLSPGGPLRVTTARLDDLLAGPIVALAKLDVEGAELDALRGAQDLLARASPPAWIIEVGRRLRDFETSEEALTAFLAARGFDCGLYDADTRELRFPPAPWRLADNVIAVSRAAREEVARRVRMVRG